MPFTPLLHRSNLYVTDDDIRSLPEFKASAAGAACQGGKGRQALVLYIYAYV